MFHRIMRSIALLPFALFTALVVLIAPPVLAQEELPRPISQIGLLPIRAETVPADITALVRAHWQPYYETRHPQAFGKDSLRVGRFDLDGDGKAELALMVVKPGWEAQHGYPLVIASWTDTGWNAVGWSWGDEDTVFASDEVVDNWRTVSTGTQLLRWDRGLYSRVDLPAVKN